MLNPLDTTLTADDSRSRLGLAVSLLIEWGRARRARLEAEQQQHDHQPDGEPQSQPQPEPTPQ